MGFLDSLLVDPTQADGGYLARLLGITPDTTSKRPTAADGVLGNAPLANALRGAFMGMRAGDGASGFLDRFGRGFATSRAYLDQRRPPAPDRTPPCKACQGDGSAAPATTGSGETLASEPAAPSSAARIPFGQDAIVIDGNGARWRYKGAGDPALLASWAPAE